MRTVRCSGRLGEGGGVCLGVLGVSARGGACPGRCHPVDRILDTRLRKHYLSATTVADGKNITKSHTFLHVKLLNVIYSHWIEWVNCRNYINVYN